MSAARVWAAICRCASRRPLRPKLPRPDFIDEFSGGSKEPHPSTTMAFVRLLGKLMKHPEFGKKIVPIVPDEARTFGMESMFRDVRHLRVRRPALQAARCRHSPLLQGIEGRPDSGRRHHRRRVDGGVHRRRHRIRELRRRYDSVLHLLLDVRFPARGRSDLGVRRFARQGLPDGRHRRAHDALRRRPAASGRPFAAARQHRSDSRGLRSRLCV